MLCTTASSTSCWREPAEPWPYGITTEMKALYGGARAPTDTHEAVTVVLAAYLVGAPNAHSGVFASFRSPPSTEAAGAALARHVRGIGNDPRLAWRVRPEYSPAHCARPERN